MEQPVSLATCGGMVASFSCGLFGAAVGTLWDMSLVLGLLGGVGGFLVFYILGRLGSLGGGGGSGMGGCSSGCGGD